jgi:hypothetical protein
VHSLSPEQVGVCLGGAFICRERFDGCRDMKVAPPRGPLHPSARGAYSESAVSRPSSVGIVPQNPGSFSDRRLLKVGGEEAQAQRRRARS